MLDPQPPLLSRLIAALTALALASLSGCAISKQARSAEGSGFLSDYSQLVPGEEDDQALLRYVNPQADWKQYTKMLIEPIAIYSAPDSDLSELGAEDRQALLDYFDAALRREVAKSISLTESSGSNTIRARIAITDAQSSNRLTDTLSNVLPYGLALSSLRELSFGKAIGVGDVQIEAEFLDAESGTRLAAAVDRRVGGKSIKGKFDEWHDVKDSFDFWALRLREGVLDVQGK